MTRTFALAALCLLCSSGVIADGIWNPTMQFVGSAGEGINSPTPGTPAPPSSCDGTIDLSTGCVMPMLGGL